MNPIQFRISTAVWRTASPAARSQTTPAGASANVVASVGSSVASALQDSKNALTQNLLDSWRRQQSTSLASSAYYLNKPDMSRPEQRVAPTGGRGQQ